VAYGLAITRDWWMRIVARLLIGISAVETLVLCAMPSRALNDAFQGQAHDVLDQILGLSPLGWLPSFEKTSPDWYIAAYLRLIPAIAIVAVLAVYGWRRRFTVTDALPLRAPNARLQLGGFLEANAIALALVAVAISQPWVSELG